MLKSFVLIEEKLEYFLLSNSNYSIELLNFITFEYVDI